MGRHDCGQSQPHHCLTPLIALHLPGTDYFKFPVNEAQLYVYHVSAPAVPFDVYLVAAQGQMPFPPNTILTPPAGFECSVGYLCCVTQALH